MIIKLNKFSFLGFRRPTVAVLRLEGVIGSVSNLRRGLSLKTTEQRLEAAFKSRCLKAVALIINSPGGSPVQSDLIAKRLRDLADEREVPIYTFIEDVGASGGYWLACAGDEIYARSSSIIGSVGVVSGGFGFAEVIRRYGIERRLYTSGDKKAMNDPFSPEKSSEVKHLKALQKEIHEDFISAVKARRGKRLNSRDQTLFSGAYWTGKQALKLGLIDGIGDLRDVMREKIGDEVHFKIYDESRSWLQRRFSIERPAVSEIGSGIAFANELIAAVEERLWWNRFGF